MKCYSSSVERYYEFALVMIVDCCTSFEGEFVSYCFRLVLISKFPHEFSLQYLYLMFKRVYIEVFVVRLDRVMFCLQHNCSFGFSNTFVNFG